MRTALVGDLQADAILPGRIETDLRMNGVFIGVVDKRIALLRATIGGGKAYRPLIRRIFTRIQRIGGIGKPIDEGRTPYRRRLGKTAQRDREDADGLDHSIP